MHVNELPVHQRRPATSTGLPRSRSGSPWASSSSPSVSPRSPASASPAPWRPRPLTAPPNPVRRSPNSTRSARLSRTKQTRRTADPTYPRSPDSWSVALAAVCLRLGAAALALAVSTVLLGAVWWWSVLLGDAVSSPAFARALRIRTTTTQRIASPEKMNTYHMLNPSRSLSILGGISGGDLIRCGWLPRAASRATQSSSAGQRGPGGADDLVVRVVGCVRWGVELVQGFDTEAEAAQEADPVAVGGVELGAAARPADVVGGCAVRGGGWRWRRPRPGTQSADSRLLVRNTSRPPGRSTRAASASQRSGSHHAAAPCSLTTRSNEAVASGTCSASACTSGKVGPVRRCSARAVRSCSADRSTATTLAPDRVSQAEQYAVPQANSSTSRPSTSPSTPSRRSGTSNSPHTISGLDHNPSAAGPVKRSLTTAHSARFTAISSARFPSIQPA